MASNRKTEPVPRSKALELEKLKGMRIGDYAPIEFTIGDKRFKGTVRCVPQE